VPTIGSDHELIDILQVKADGNHLGRDAQFYVLHIGISVEVQLDEPTQLEHVAQ
jgi:hypothetical protein